MQSYIRSGQAITLPQRSSIQVYRKNAIQHSVFVRKGSFTPFTTPPRLFSLNARGRKKDDAEDQSTSTSPSSFQDTLMQREQLLWDRQTQLMETALEDARKNYGTLLHSYEQLQSQLLAERQAWARQEELYRKENSDLRNQLLFTAAQVARISSSQQSKVSKAGGRDDDVDDDDVLDGRAATAELPQSAFVQASATNNTDPTATTTSSPHPLQEDHPSWTAEIQAAIKAVNDFDVLTDDVDYSELAKVKTRQNEERSVDAQEPPQHPPPELSLGSDDIYWVNQLHTALVDAGYFPGDEDIDDFYYGPSTLNAVMTMQACEGLSETGMVDQDTWKVLLGPTLLPKESRDLNADQLTPNVPGITTKSTKPFVELFSAAMETSAAVDPSTDHVEFEATTAKITETDVYEDGTAVVVQTAAVSTSSVASHVAHKRSAVPDKWPTLIEGDGGKEVHALHVLLEDAGFSAGEDDVRWWQFGLTTMDAVKTFQACSGLPESGVCDAKTWKALMGPEASPSDILHVTSGRSDDEDLADTGGGTRVWLLGEQRWEDRSKMNK